MTRKPTVRPGIAERPRTVPARPLSQTDVQAEVLSLAEATQGALDRKADVEVVPLPAETAPISETTTAAPGADRSHYALPDHQHPRLTSATKVTLDASGLATATFTRSFAVEPAVDLTPIVPGGTQPVMLQVDSWVKTGQLFTGCVVRGYRARSLPTPLTLLSALVGYSVTGPANGVGVSVIALQASAV